MPANLASAVPSGVFPLSLCLAFSESRSFPMLATPPYHDGTIERSLIQDGVNAPQSLRTYATSRRLTAAQVATFFAFWTSQHGGLIPFYFYHPIEVAPGQAIGANYDPFGSLTQGRHVCVIASPQWMQTTDLARTNISVSLREVA